MHLLQDSIARPGAAGVCFDVSGHARVLPGGRYGAIAVIAHRDNRQVLDSFSVAEDFPSVAEAACAGAAAADAWLLVIQPLIRGGGC